MGRALVGRRRAGGLDGCLLRLGGERGGGGEGGGGAARVGRGGRGRGGGGAGFPMVDLGGRAEEVVGGVGGHCF